MTHSRRLYFDQAATTWPKLPEAVAAAEEFVHQCGATSGRGAYASARAADHWLTQARHNLSRLFGGRDAGDVALCTSGTHALNAILLGLIRPGDHVLTTAIEHNSVLRPLEYLRRSRSVRVSVVPCDEGGQVDLEAAREMLRREPARVVVLSHASNVSGRLQDAALWSELAHEHGAWLVVDASQTAGYLPISMEQMGIDALASAGHKGLGALAGTGFLIATPEVQAAVEPLMFGGTGFASEQLDFLPKWPQTIEVGNLNLPGVVSMAAAAEVWLHNGGAAMLGWRPALERFVSGIRRSPKRDQLRLIGHREEPSSGAGHEAGDPTASQPEALSSIGLSSGSADSSETGVTWLPIVSLQLHNWDIHEAAAVLDANFGVETRAGFHCAALIHQALGTHAEGGTLRFSLSHHTSLVDVDDALHAIQSIL